MTFTITRGATRYIRHGHTCLGVAGPTGLTLTAGGHNDSLLWSRNPASGAGQLHTWSPWGNGNPTDGLPGFNGERPDPVSGSYHLGNGYRAYNPVLKRFNCPDSMSPFGAGGINPYAYCSGDPVNYTDPTGHISWQGILGIIGGIIGLGLSLFTAGASIAAAGSIAAAVSSASTTALVVGGLGIAADVTAIASGATEDVNPEASSVLGWVSMATGIAGMAAGAGAAGIQRMKRASAGASWRTPEGRVGIEMSGRGAPAAARQWAASDRYAAVREMNGTAQEQAIAQLSREGIYLRHPEIPGDRVFSFSNGRYTAVLHSRVNLDLENIQYSAYAIYDARRLGYSQDVVNEYVTQANAHLPPPYTGIPYYTEGDLYDAPPTYDGITERIAPPVYNENTDINAIRRFITRNLPSNSRARF